MGFPGFDQEIVCFLRYLNLVPEAIAVNLCKNGRSDRIQFETGGEYTKGSYFAIPSNMNIEYSFI